VIFAVKSHMFAFCEHPQNSWGCCEVWKLAGMLLCFGGTVLILLFYVRGSKVSHAQSRNPLEMLVGTSSAHFPYLRNKGSSQWRQLRPEWKPQHRSGKNLQEVATPACCEACEPCDLLWKLAFRVIIEIGKDNSS